MIWWISGGIVALALLVLILAVGSVLGSLRRFGVVAMAVHGRLTDGAHRAEPRLRQLQERLTAMEPKLVAAQERALIIQARRGEEPSVNKLDG